MRLWLLIKFLPCSSVGEFPAFSEPGELRFRNETTMCSTSSCPALHISLPSVASISSHSRGSTTRFGRAHVASPLRHLRPGRVARVARIRGLAGENGVSEKEETPAASSTGENGKPGAAVTDAAAASSSKGFGASVRAGPAKPASTKEKKKKPGTIRRSARCFSLRRRRIECRKSRQRMSSRSHSCSDSSSWTALH